MSKLPDLKVTPVSRSDDSGTTKNFTEYLSAAAPDVWKDKAEGIWPASLKGENAKGTSGVVKTVTDTPGAVTYADDSAVGGKLGTAQIKVGSEFVKISPEAAPRPLTPARPSKAAPRTTLPSSWTAPPPSPAPTPSSWFPTTWCAPRTPSRKPLT